MSVVNMGDFASCPITKEDVARTGGQAFQDLPEHLKKACGGTSGDIFQEGLKQAFDYKFQQNWNTDEEKNLNWVDPMIEIQEKIFKRQEINKNIESVTSVVTDTIKGLPWQVLAVFGGIVVLFIMRK